jgi:hypothetical protein
LLSGDMKVLMEAKCLWEAIPARLPRWFGGNLQPYCDSAVFATRGVAPHDQSVNAEPERRISRDRAEWLFFDRQPTPAFV